MPTLADALKDNAFNIKRTIEDLVEDGNTDTIIAAAAAVPYPTDGSTYTYRSNGNLYNEATGEIDCSGLGQDTSLFVKWTANVNSASPAGATLTFEVVIPDGAGPGTDIVAYSKDYVMVDATPIAVSNSTVFYLSSLVIANNLRVQISASSNNVVINNRALLTVH